MSSSSRRFKQEKLISEWSPRIGLAAAVEMTRARSQYGPGYCVSAVFALIAILPYELIGGTAMANFMAWGLVLAACAAMWNMTLFNIRDRRVRIFAARHYNVAHGTHIPKLLSPIRYARFPARWDLLIKLGGPQGKNARMPKWTNDQY
jgi:hypothetical protein